MSLDPNNTDDKRVVNPLPLFVVLLALAIGAIEAVMSLAELDLIGGAEMAGLRLTAIEKFGFYEPLMQWMIDNETIRAKYFVRFVSYPFIQGSFTHAAFVLVFLLALGKWVGEAMGQRAVIAVFFGASIIGAVVYGFVWDTRQPLFGGYPGAYGLVGAFTLVLWAHLGETGGQQYKAFLLIAMLLAVQFIFGLFFGAGKGWVAEVAGFVSGFGIALVVQRGAWERILARIRSRS